MRLGSDPEVLLLNRKTQQHQSVIGMICANKWNPRQIPGMLPGFTLQEDNVALEFGIPPASSADEFVKNIRSVLQAGLSTLPGTRFSRLSCTVFPESEMQEPLAHIFGCEPDFNAWTGKENPKPMPPHPFMRSAGGHIHVETELDKENVIRAMDLFLGVPSVLLDPDMERRKLYGKAGAYRPKPYGVEYRTLSNFWIFQPRLIKWVWNQTEKALKDVFEWERYTIEDGETPEGSYFEYTMRQKHRASVDIQHCINTGDQWLAQALVEEFQLEMPCS